MLAMAEQTTSVTGTGALAQGVTKPRNFVLPKRAAVARAGTVETLGALLGLFVLAGVVVLSVMWVKRRRGLREIRASLEDLAQTEARVASHLAAGRAPAPPPPRP